MKIEYNSEMEIVFLHANPCTVKDKWIEAVVNELTNFGFRVVVLFDEVINV